MPKTNMCILNHTSRSKRQCKQPSTNRGLGGMLALPVVNYQPRIRTTERCNPLCPTTE